MATRRPTMDHSRDRSPEEGAPQKSFYNPVIYKPLPDKAGSKVTNKLFVSLLAPYRWQLFNPTPEMVGLYGMVGTGDQLVSIPSDLTTYSFKIPVHFTKSNGFVLCPVSFNRYLTEVHGYGALFDRPRCAHCEKSNEHWSVHNKRWQELGYDKERKSNMGKDEYIRVRNGDSILKSSHEAARQFSSQDRYLIQVWDHDKFTGNRQMDEEQTQLQFQFWLAPHAVHNTLDTLFTNGSDFFDPTAEPGIQIIWATKDTTKCSGNNLSQTKYEVLPGKVEKYAQDFVAYFDNVAAWPDPMGMINLATYEDMRREILGAEAEAAEDEVPMEAPVPRTVAAPPVAPHNPGPASFRPQAAPAAPTPPVAPAPAPQAAPRAPVPQAPTAAPPAPSAPVPMSPPTAPAMPSFGGTAPLAPGMAPDRSGSSGKRHNW